MPLDPGYGQTPLEFEELSALFPEARALLPEPVTKAAVYDLEQVVQAAVTEDLLTDVLEGDLGLDSILTDRFVSELHGRLYRDIWRWAGIYRRQVLNIGVDPAHISTQLRASVDNIRHRWEHTGDWTPRQLGVVVHAECVRIHPFADGNGRSTRLLADLVFAAAQNAETVELYDWRIDRARYIQLLRAYDEHRDPKELAALIPVYSL